ncbi:sn-glycerol-3-phosphate ABC transporter ATP-binding protein UgpC [Alkalinema sp. FACHB-956]|uniref:ABC transporter ATP-binding protein n=1 Tax=Alkalinema sp. FACHB-956 TaxID=2692768 RepID=UPI001685B32D|nr:sn-glycerol-3-phosphate ABC transporter ATP-binding protein UgpC [Alkalinema sp. FACHB-956]MBD2328914.1 sn-glycerol-3-phosphate ABC transporter ATP-binding protein UgpC [Alkalinema sp. FACHB-956]
MATVRLENLVRHFPGGSQVGEVSFTIPDGQFWVLVGPSGCGKSTILRMLAGLETPTGGDLYIADRRVNDVPARQRDVAMVFQNYALYPHMTVRENLSFGLKMRQVDPATMQSRVQEVAEILDITALLDRKPKQLSGGQQQRVALGRAIARNPQLFLLDEPLSNLDAQLRDDTRTELKRLHQTLGITTVYVTHDQTEAMTLADQIVVLDRGQVQQIGDPQTIYNQPANRMVATFLGSPPMNILSAQYWGDRWQVEGQSFTLGELGQSPALPETLRSGQTYDLGIRPEYLAINATNPHVYATIEVIEPLGRETLVRVRVGNLALMLIVPIGQSLQVGDRLPITLDPNQLFIFDPETGDRIYPAA